MSRDGYVRVVPYPGLDGLMHYRCRIYTEDRKALGFEGPVLDSRALMEQYAANLAQDHRLEVI